MILIAIVGMGMMFGMPYLMDNSTFITWMLTREENFELIKEQWTRR